MAKDPAVLFYTNDFLSRTITMTNEQVGKYIRLLCIQHQQGYLTEKDMLNICKSYDEDVYLKFVKDGDKYFNERMKVETEKRKKYSESRKNNRISIKDNNICKSYDNHMEDENININENVLKEERTVSSSNEPTITEVISYFDSCGFNKTDAQNFYSYYSAQNWETKGGKSIKARWQNKVIQWMNNQKQFNIPKNTSKFTATEEKYYDCNKRKNNDHLDKVMVENSKKIAEQGLYNPLADQELQKIIGSKKVIDIKPKPTVKQIDKNSPDYKRKLSLMNQQIDQEIKKGA